MKNLDFWAKSGPNPDQFAPKSPDPDQSPEIRTYLGALLVDVLDVVAHVNSFLYTYIDVEHAAAAITIV